MTVSLHRLAGPKNAVAKRSNSRSAGEMEGPHRMRMPAAEPRAARSSGVGDQVSGAEAESSRGHDANDESET